MFKTFQKQVGMLYRLHRLSRINALKDNGHIAMSFIGNVHKGNCQHSKEHVGLVVLRASLAARKPNCELIMGLVTRSPKEAEVRVRRGRALCHPYIRGQIVGFCKK